MPASPVPFVLGSMCLRTMLLTFVERIDRSINPIDWNKLEGRGGHREKFGQKSKIIEKRRRRRTKDEGLKLIDTIDFRTNERTNEGNIWPVSRISQGRWWKGNGKGGETRENARSAARLRKSHARKMGFTCHGGEDSEREDSFLFLRG